MHKHLIVAAISAVLAAAAAPAHAVYTVTFRETGGNVVATGSGSVNTTDLTKVFGPPLGSASVNPSNPSFFPNDTAFRERYEGITGPDSFGTGAGNGTHTFTGTGASLLKNTYNAVVTETGYVSGSPLSGTTTFNNETFQSLGLTPGIYTWTWGTGNNADSYVIVVASAVQGVPTLTEWSLAGLASLIALFGLTRGRRRSP